MKLVTALLGVFVLAASGCGSAGSNDDSSAAAGVSEAGANTDGGSGGGTMSLDGETITFSSSECTLDPQEAIIGGGQILFTAEGFGTNAAGDQVTLDISRYDEDSDYTGDEVVLDFGDMSSADSVRWTAIMDLGEIDVDGSTVRSNDVTVITLDIEGGGGVLTFEIDC